jgi:hypothetical protein
MESMGEPSIEQGSGEEAVTPENEQTQNEDESFKMRISELKEKLEADLSNKENPEKENRKP